MEDDTKKIDKLYKIVADSLADRNSLIGDGLVSFDKLLVDIRDKLGFIADCLRSIDERLQ